jgi:DNA-binding transcriptional ArsR family regulator
MDHTLEMAQVIMEPIRASIIKSLVKGANYIGAIADELKLDRSVVAYHLSILEKNNLVGSEYQILVPPHSPGKAARFYKLNIDFYTKIIIDIETLLPELKP